MMAKVTSRTKLDHMENYKPFISEGVVLLVGDENSSQKVKILRDTGAAQSLMLDRLLPLTENSFTGTHVLISVVVMGVLEVPLHEVNIKSSLINGNIVIGMISSLSVEGISLILGNDLSSERVMVDPRVVFHTPSRHQHGLQWALLLWQLGACMQSQTDVSNKIRPRPNIMQIPSGHPVPNLEIILS